MIKQIQLEPGAELRVGDRLVTFHAAHNLKKCIVIDNATREKCIVSYHDLAPITQDTALSSKRGKELSEFTKKQWDLANERYAQIEPLLGVRNRTADLVAARALETGTSTATLYRYLDAYKDKRLVGLIDRRSYAQRSTRLPLEVENVIEDAIEETYLVAERPTDADLVEEVKKRCHRLGLRKPSRNAIVKRRRRKSGRKAAHARGNKRELERHTAKAGSFDDNGIPQLYYQVDHTPINLKVVDEEERRSIGRPHLTMVIETSTKVVAGFYLSLDSPSAMSVALALHHAFFPKKEFLDRLGVPGDWDIWGLPDYVHADNGSDFRSEGYIEGLRQNEINPTWRSGSPEDGGAIERALGTTNRKLLQNPGRIFRPDENGRGYDSDGLAIFTLHELEVMLTEWIVNDYHVNKHSGLGGRTPMAVFEERIFGTESILGRGVPDIPTNPRRVLLDFLPVARRTIQPYGIQLEGVRYYTPEIAPYVGLPNEHADDGKYIIRYDKRAASPIFFYAHDIDDYIEVPYANLSRPIVSMWELEAARKHLADLGRDEIDEDRIFDARDRMAKIREDAQQETQSTRKARQKDRSREASKARTVGTQRKPKPPKPADDMDDDFDPMDVDLDAIEAL